MSCSVECKLQEGRAGPVALHTTAPVPRDASHRRVLQKVTCASAAGAPDQLSRRSRSGAIGAGDPGPHSSPGLPNQQSLEPSLLFQLPFMKHLLNAWGLKLACASSRCEMDKLLVA